MTRGVIRSDNDFGGNDMGWFVDVGALNAAIPVGQNGWFVEVGSQMYIWDSGTSTWILSSGGGASDEMFKVDLADTTPGFGADKIVAGTGLVVNILNIGGNEQIEIALGSTPVGPYTSISSPQAGTYELGDTVGVVLNEVHTKNTNNLVDLLYRRNGGGIHGPVAIGPASGVDTYTDTGLTSTGQVTFSYTTKVTDTAALVGNSNTVYVAFVPMVFWGYNVGGAPLTEADIEGLQYSALRSGRTAQYNFAATGLGNHKYICIPNTFGALPNPASHDIIDVATNFTVPFALEGTVMTTNPFGVVISYLVYKSVNVIGGIANLAIIV